MNEVVWYVLGFLIIYFFFRSRYKKKQELVKKTESEKESEIREEIDYFSEDTKRKVLLASQQKNKTAISNSEKERERKETQDKTKRDTITRLVELKVKEKFKAADFHHVDANGNYDIRVEFENVHWYGTDIENYSLLAANILELGWKSVNMKEIEDRSTGESTLYVTVSTVKEPMKIIITSADSGDRVYRRTEQGVYIEDNND